MKRAAVLFTVALTTLLLSGPAVARDPSGTTKSTDFESRGAQTTAPAEKPGALAVPHHVEGNVVSVNKSANTIVVRDTKGQQFNLGYTSAYRDVNDFDIETEAVVASQLARGPD